MDSPRLRSSFFTVPSQTFKSWEAIPKELRDVLAFVGEIGTPPHCTRFWCADQLSYQDGTQTFHKVIVDASRTYQGILLDRVFIFRPYITLSEATPWMLMPFEAPVIDKAAAKGGAA